ncbi:hypothetical protein [Photorhabdus antumapuensis]|nr:hypothetical protein [Photorhabdus antumapuensis]MCA6220811.1 hypothetical protein [Photorhabdus antumapuensis]
MKSHQIDEAKQQQVTLLRQASELIPISPSNGVGLTGETDILGVFICT